mgnify:CR=1 FL=1
MALNPANVAPISAYAGDALTQTFRLTRDGAAIDLDAANWTDWRAQYRTSVFSPEALDFTVDATLASEGKITVELPASQTEELQGSGVYDLQASQGEVVRTWLKGTIEWTKGVTRG